MGVGVGVGVFVGRGVGVFVGVLVGLGVGVFVGLGVGVFVGRGVGVPVGFGTGVKVGLGVLVGTGVLVAVGKGVFVGAEVGEGVFVGATVGVTVGMGVTVTGTRGILMDPSSMSVLSALREQPKRTTTRSIVKSNKTFFIRCPFSVDHVNNIILTEKPPNVNIKGGEKPHFRRNFGHFPKVVFRFPCNGAGYEPVHNKLGLKIVILTTETVDIQSKVCYNMTRYG